MMMPTFGAEPRFGTHPIAWAAPAGDEDGFLFDVSCCQVAANKVTLARRLQVKLAKNWVTDDDGAPIDHEHDPLPNATQRMLPFGGEREQGSHKGYGLACMIDIMANALAGVGPGFVTGGGGTVFTATNIEAFTDMDTYHAHADAFFEGLRTTPPAPGEERVLYPGMLGGELRRQRTAEGLPYHPEVLNWFRAFCPVHLIARCSDARSTVAANRGGGRGSRPRRVLGGGCRGVGAHRCDGGGEGGLGVLRHAGPGPRAPRRASGACMHSSLLLPPCRLS